MDGGVNMCACISLYVNICMWKSIWSGNCTEIICTRPDTELKPPKSQLVLYRTSSPVYLNTIYVCLAALMVERCINIGFFRPRFYD